MCNEIDERLAETYIGTITGESADSVEFSLYPEGHEDQLLFGNYPREQMVRAGIDISLYDTFVVDSWTSPSGRTHLELRPHIYRELSREEVMQIKRKIESLFPESLSEEDK